MALPETVNRTQPCADKKETAPAQHGVFELGYTLSSLTPAPTTLKTNVIYINVEEEDGPRFYLKYKVATPDNKIIESRIPWKELPSDFPETTDKILKNNGLPPIIKLISKEHPILRPENQLLQVFEKKRIMLNADQKEILDPTFDIEKMNALFCQFDKKSLIHKHAWFDEKVGLVNTASYRKVVATIRDYARSQLDQQLLKLSLITATQKEYQDAIDLLNKALNMEIFKDHQNNFRLTRFWKDTNAIGHIKQRLNDFTELLESYNNPQIDRSV